MKRPSNNSEFIKAETSFIKQIDPSALLDKYDFKKIGNQSVVTGEYLNKLTGFKISVTQKQGHYLIMNFVYNALDNIKTGNTGTIVDLIHWMDRSKNFIDCFEIAREFAAQSDPMGYKALVDRYANQNQVRIPKAEGGPSVDLMTEAFYQPDIFKLAATFDNSFEPAVDFSYLESRGITAETYNNSLFIGKIGGLDRQSFKVFPYNIEDISGYNTEDYAFNSSIVFPLTNPIESGNSILGLHVVNRLSEEAVAKTKIKFEKEHKDPNKVTASIRIYAKKSSHQYAAWVSNIPVKPTVLIIGEQPMDLMSRFQVADDKLELEKNAIFFATGGRTPEYHYKLINDLIKKHGIQDVRFAFDSDVAGQNMAINIAARLDAFYAPDKDTRFSSTTSYDQHDLIVKIHLAKIKGRAIPNASDVAKRLITAENTFHKLAFEGSSFFPTPVFSPGNRNFAELIISPSRKNLDALFRLISASGKMEGKLKLDLAPEGFKDWNDFIQNKKSVDKDPRISLLESSLNKSRKPLTLEYTSTGEINVKYQGQLRGAATQVYILGIINPTTGNFRSNDSLLSGDNTFKLISKVRDQFQKEVGILSGESIQLLLTQNIKFSEGIYSRADGTWLAKTNQGKKDIEFNEKLSNLTVEESNSITWMHEARWLNKDPDKELLQFSKNSIIHPSLGKIGIITKGFEVEMVPSLFNNKLPHYLDEQLSLIIDHLNERKVKTQEFVSLRIDQTANLKFLKVITVKNEKESQKKLTREELLVKLKNEQKLTVQLLNANTPVLELSGKEFSAKYFIDNPHPYYNDIVKLLGQHKKPEVFPSGVYIQGDKVLAKIKGSYIEAGDIKLDGNNKPSSVSLSKEVIGLSEILRTITNLKVQEFVAEKQSIQIETRAPQRNIIFSVLQPDTERPGKQLEKLMFNELPLGYVEDGKIVINIANPTSKFRALFADYERANIAEEKWQFAQRGINETIATPQPVIKLNPDVEGLKIDAAIQPVKPTVETPAFDTVPADLRKSIQRQFSYDFENAGVYFPVAGRKRLVGEWDQKNGYFSSEFLSQPANHAINAVLNKEVYNFLNSQFNVQEFKLVEGKYLNTALEHEPIKSISNKSLESKLDLIRNTLVIADFLRDPKFKENTTQTAEGIAFQCLRGGTENFIVYNDRGVSQKGTDENPIFVSRASKGIYPTRLVYTEDVSDLVGYYYSRYPNSIIDMNTIFCSGIKGQTEYDVLSNLAMIYKVENIEIVGSEEFRENLGPKLPKDRIITFEQTGETYLSENLRALIDFTRISNSFEQSEIYLSAFDSPQFQSVGRLLDESYLFPFININKEVCGNINLGVSEIANNTNEGIYLSRPIDIGNKSNDHVVLFNNIHEALAYQIIERPKPNVVFMAFDGKVSEKQVAVVNMLLENIPDKRIAIANTHKLLEDLRQLNFRRVDTYNPGDNFNTFKREFTNRIDSINEVNLKLKVIGQTKENGVFRNTSSYKAEEVLIENKALDVHTKISKRR